MPRFMISVHRPNGFDHAAVLDDAVRRDIDAVNDAMEAAGVRVFVGGLRPVDTSRSIRRTPDGGADVSEGSYLKADAYVDGFWVVDVPDMAAALDWGRRAAAACRGDIEVRPFY